MKNTAPELLPGEIELTVPEMVAYGMRLHRDNRLDAAKKCYEAVLQVDPENANALHYMGVLHQQGGKKAMAIELVRRSIAIDPNVAAWHNNLGNLLLDNAQYEAASSSYARCSELDAGNLEILNNLGVLQRKLGRPAQAEASFKRAIAVNPGFADAHANLATLLCTIPGRMPEAYSHLADAMALAPRNSNIRRLLVLTYAKSGRMEDGRKACQEWIDVEPDDPQALHYWAALGCTAVPERASDAYVVQEFDGFAGSFDAKLAMLDYRAPQWVGEAVARLSGEPKANLRVLDLGCGTGLCGPYLKPYAERLIGVDLSANMMAQASERLMYDELVKAELVAYLATVEMPQDIVVSADTLCYFGRLDAAFAGVHAALRRNGIWVFTVEAHPGEQPFTLQLHGRYSHARSYVESNLLASGFGAIEVYEVDLRLENNEPVPGWLVTAKAQ
jgi:predicted TPR repeat methyltransferase